MKRAKVFVGELFAGVLTEDDMGYEFQYNPEYLSSDKAVAVSLTLPLSGHPYKSNVLFPFFDGRLAIGYCRTKLEDFSKRPVCAITCLLQGLHRQRFNNS